MKSVGTADLKARLSAHLREVRDGETLVVLHRNEPIACIVPIERGFGGLKIRPAVGPLHDIELPAPLSADDEMQVDL